jgi:hypothetical protein
MVSYLPGLGSSSGFSFSPKEVGSGFTHTVKIAVKHEREEVMHPIHDTKARRYKINTIDSHLNPNILSTFRQIKMVYTAETILKQV